LKGHFEAADKDAMPRQKSRETVVVPVVMEMLVHEAIVFRRRIGRRAAHNSANGSKVAHALIITQVPDLLADLATAISVGGRRGGGGGRGGLGGRGIVIRVIILIIVILLVVVVVVCRVDHTPRGRDAVHSPPHSRSVVLGNSGGWSRQSEEDVRSEEEGSGWCVLHCKQAAGKSLSEKDELQRKRR